MLVYMLLLSLLMTGIYAVYTATMSYARINDASNQLQTGAQMTLLSLTGELSECSEPYVEASWYYDAGTGALTAADASCSNPVGIIFLSPRGAGNRYDPISQRLIWKTWVCYYYDTAARKIVRKEWALSPLPSTTPPTSSGKKTSDFQSQAGLPTRVIAQNITSFTPCFVNPDPLPVPANRNLVRITSKLELTVVSNKAGTSDNRINIEDEVMLRNQ